MADSVTLTFRGIALEDLATSPLLQQITGTVLGLGGGGIALTPIVVANSDSGASAAGLNAGDVYLNNSVAPIRLRANQVSGGGGGGGSAPTKFSNTMIATPGSINDGEIIVLGTTIALVGAIVGDGVLLGSIPALPAGVWATAKVTAPNVVTVEIMNMTGATVSIGATTFNGSVFH
jgi:hypothetical protein